MERDNQYTFSMSFAIINYLNTKTATPEFSDVAIIHYFVTILGYFTIIASSISSSGSIS